MQQKKGASGAPYIKLEVKAEISDSFELDFNVPLNFAKFPSFAETSRNL